MISLTRIFLAVPIAALALFSFSMTAQAQTPPTTTSAGSDLSSSQQARMKARQDQFQRDLAALRADPKMTNPQKQIKYNAMVQAMDKDLMAVLTPMQRAGEVKRQQVNAQFKKDVAALSADKSMTVAQKKARYLTLVQAADAQTLATLTPSQRAVAVKQHQTQSEALQVANELQKSQSPAQAKQIHDISIAARTQMQAVIADKTLSPQVKTARIKEMTNKEEGQISALLSPSQRVKFTRWQQLISATQRQ